MLCPKDPNSKEKRLVIITMYNPRIYQIDGITFNISPKSHMISWNHTDPITNKKEVLKTNLLEYFRIKYGLTVDRGD